MKGAALVGTRKAEREAVDDYMIGLEGEVLQQGMVANAVEEQ